MEPGFGRAGSGGAAQDSSAALLGDRRLWNNPGKSCRSRVQVIDADGFRPNVGIVICNAEGKLLWAKRIGQNAWQFPQGGIQRGEKPEQALFRELGEELGLTRDDVQILGVTSGWLRYRLPSRYLRRSRGRVCIGQKQKWFALRLIADDTAVRLDASDKPEFDGWRWVDYWLPLDEVVEFKREVYHSALRELAGVLSGPPHPLPEVPVQRC